MRSTLVPTRAVDGEIVDVDVARLGGIALLLLRHCFFFLISLSSIVLGR